MTKQREYYGINLDTYAEDVVICPYCLTRYEDCFEWGDGYESSDEEEICDNCGRTFIWYRDISVTYTTKRVEKGVDLENEN